VIGLVVAADATISHTLVKLKFHGSSFHLGMLIAFSWYPHLTRMSATSRPCHARGLWKTTPIHGQTTSTTPQQTAGRPIGQVATPDTHDLLRTSSRGCHEDASRNIVPWNLSYTARMWVAVVWSAGRSWSDGGPGTSNQSTHHLRRDSFTHGQLHVHSQQHSRQRHANHVTRRTLYLFTLMYLTLLTSK